MQEEDFSRQSDVISDISNQIVPSPAKHTDLVLAPSCRGDDWVIFIPFQKPFYCCLGNRDLIQLDSWWSCAEPWEHLSAGMRAPLCPSAPRMDLGKPGPVPRTLLSPGCVSVQSSWLILLQWQRIANMKCSLHQNGICVSCIVNTHWHADAVVNIRTLRGY